MNSRIKFTPREIEILELVSKGKSREKIPDLLNMGKGTYENHLRTLYLKTNCHSFADLTFFCLKSDFRKMI